MTHGVYLLLSKIAPYVTPSILSCSAFPLANNPRFTAINKAYTVAGVRIKLWDRTFDP